MFNFAACHGVDVLTFWKDDLVICVHDQDAVNSYAFKLAFETVGVGPEQLM